MTWRGGVLFPGTASDLPYKAGEEEKDPNEAVGGAEHEETEEDAMVINIYNFAGHLVTFVTNDPGCTLWDAATMIRQRFQVARKDQHLVLGILMPPFSATLRSLVPTSSQIDLTLVISPRECRCGFPRPQHACGSCRSKWYCSDACAGADWADHRVECRISRRFQNWAQLYQDYLAQSVLHH